MRSQGTHLYDVLILGQGLAGSTLARTLLAQGMDVMVVDVPHLSSASHIAAGLITPITGPRLVLTENWHDLWPTARNFYQRFESETGIPIFHERPAIRVLANAEEQAKFEQRLESLSFRNLVDRRPETPNTVFTPFGAFAMQPAAQLDTTQYLSAAAERLKSEERLIEAQVNQQHVDLQSDATTVSISGLNLRAKRLIDCRGHVSAEGNWFSRIGWANARGEILSVRILELIESRSLHRHCWIAPAGSEHYRIGATFDWENLDAGTTEAARIALLERASKILTCPIEVTGQLAAVRPAIRDVHPVVGFLAADPRIGILNGLGSKGVLLAPTLAEVLADNLQTGKPVPQPWSLSRWDL